MSFPFPLLLSLISSLVCFILKGCVSPPSVVRLSVFVAHVPCQYRCLYFVYSLLSACSLHFFSASFSGFSFMPAWCPAFGSSFEVQKYNRTHRLTRPQPILMLNSRHYGSSMPCSLSCLDTGINREGRRKMRRSPSRTEKY